MGERVSDFVISWRIVHVSEKEVRADDKRTARLGLAPHRLLRYTSSPSLASPAFALTSRQPRGTGAISPPTPA